MKLNTMFLAALILGAVAYVATAAETLSPETIKVITAESKPLPIAEVQPVGTTAEVKPIPTAQDQLFRAGEVQLDLNGFTRTQNLKDFSQGGGFGVNWLPWRAAGGGIEFMTRDTKRSFFDNIGVSLIGRMPVDKLHIAPEFKVGYDFDFEKNHKGLEPHEVFASVGGELRLTKNVGLGIEVRGVRPLDGPQGEYLLGIARLRFSL